ncbi:MAG: cupin domain-containing protein [Sphingobacteriales bacterium]|nr:MAG: cupin domain-containing protein [Sphingobacteriales bacterium]
MNPDIRITAHSQTDKLNIAGGEYRVLVPGTQTNGSYAIIKMSVPPGAGPVPHAHPDFEELFFVLEGQLNFYTKEGSTVVQKGDTVVIPKGGMIHNFKNLADQPAKLLCTVMPAGLDQFFTEAAAYLETQPDNATEMKQFLQTLAEKYGQQLYPADYWETII